MYLQDIVNAATEAAIHAAYADARAKGLKAAAIGAAERARASTGAHIREVASDQRLGTLRLDAANLPAAPVIAKPDEVTSWLVEHAPQLVEASFRVPVGKLEEILALLEFAGVSGPDVSARVEFRDATEASAWLVKHCIVQADPEIPRAWNVLHRDAEGHLTPVPGVIGVQPNPYWVVRTDDTHRASAVATAREEVDGLVAELAAADLAVAAVAADRADLRDEAAAIEDDEDDAPAGIMGGAKARLAALSAGVDAALARRGEYLALRRADLADLCRDRDLTATGNKVELADRLLEADGLVAGAPTG